MLNSQETRILETSYDRLKSREITFCVSNTGKILPAGVFRWVTNIHEHKKILLYL